MSKVKEENREKDAALSRALTDIEKRFGKGSIMRLGEKGAKVSVEAISTGVLPLDLATGVGGMPRGRVVEIYGPESSGKTTVALHVIAQAQKAGGFAAFIDAEHALDPLYAEKLGVNIEELLVAQPDNGEQALEICGALVSSGAVDVIAIDSVAALVPRAEIEGEMGDAHVGLQARLMSQALRKLTSFVHKTNTLVIFINQLREKVGIVYGSPEVTAGGRALKFYSSIRLEVRKAQDIKSGADKIGNRVKMKITKNKVAPPFKQAEVELFYGEGVSEEMCLVDLGEQHQVIEKSGSWYSFGGTRLGQGRENVRQFLKEHPEMTAEIRSRIIEAAMPAKDNVVPFKQAEAEGD